MYGLAKFKFAKFKFAKFKFAKFVIWYIFVSIFLKPGGQTERPASIWNGRTSEKRLQNRAMCSSLCLSVEWSDKGEYFNYEVNHLTPIKNKGVDRNWYTSLSEHCHSVKHWQRYGRTGGGGVILFKQQKSFMRTNIRLPRRQFIITTIRRKLKN